MILSKNYLEKLPKNQLINLAEFVVSENFKHHANNKLPQDYKNDVNSIYEEEMNYYENSEVYTAKDTEGTILGAIRILKWNYTDVLPLQKIFGINPFFAIHVPNVHNIYHIGRFAIKKEVRDINLFKKLLASVAELICTNTGNVAFAECDSKLLRILKLLGVKPMVIGESVNYLGSETIPIAMTYDGIIDFYNKNKHLVDHNSNETSESYEIPNNNVHTPMSYSA